MVLRMPPNYEDVEQITVEDPYTISFQLDAPNVAFLDYMTMGSSAETSAGGRGYAGV